MLLFDVQCDHNQPPMIGRIKTLSILVIALALAVSGGVLQVHETRINRYNRALQHNNFNALMDASVQGKFIRAWRHQISGEFADASATYNQILHLSPPTLANKIQFNLATMYLQQAIVARSEEAKDKAQAGLPLIELSKHIYRKLLADSADLWPAKHNLEIAISLAPDNRLPTIPEDILPERSPESHGVIEKYKKLP